MACRMKNKVQISIPGPIFLEVFFEFTGMSTTQMDPRNENQTVQSYNQLSIMFGQKRGLAMRPFALLAKCYKVLVSPIKLFFQAAPTKVAHPFHQEYPQLCFGGLYIGKYTGIRFGLGTYNEP